MKALSERAAAFAAAGCRSADQSFGSLNVVKSDAAKAQAVFVKAMNGEMPTAQEIAEYQSQIMLDLGKIYNKYGFVMQLHLSALRSCNTRMFRQAGANTGFDAIGDGTSSESLAKLLDSLAVESVLPKTIVYSLNENDNVKNASVIGGFQEGCFPPKMQLGMAWWFNDNIKGMVGQMVDYANASALGGFIGMLTDSRSFLSYTRHEYFRRIMCNLLGTWAEGGQLALETAQLGKIVQDISYNNAVAYFGITEKK